MKLYDLLAQNKSNSLSRNSGDGKGSFGGTKIATGRQGYCMRLLTQLRFTRLQYTKVNIWQDPDAAAFVRSVAEGNETVPTVTVAGRAMVNPSKRELLEAVEAYAPHLLRKSG
ncbi:glutaredoxin domain-containing protein [Streptomyces sp. NPDC057002]|uniref:glutaredoxin domain-containing protein n=1 Tax=Streptomyces sp. NPDC057002 TaxID=3345992 RepID=UPI0036309798